MIFRKNKTQSAQKTKPKTSKEYEEMGRQIEALYNSVNPSKRVFYRMAFLKGVLGGVGGVIGATVVIALLIWVLSLFGDVPLIGNFVDAIRRTIENGPAN